MPAVAAATGAASPTATVEPAAVSSSPPLAPSPPTAPKSIPPLVVALTGGDVLAGAGVPILRGLTAQATVRDGADGAIVVGVSSNAKAGAPARLAVALGQARVTTDRRARCCC